MRFISHLTFTTDICIDGIYIGDEKYDIYQLLNVDEIQNYKFKAECYFLYENKNTLHIKLIFKNKESYSLTYELSGYEHEYDLLIHKLDYSDDYIIVKNI